jgi:protein-tyrosine kinase
VSELLEKPTRVNPRRVESLISVEKEMLGLYYSLDNVFPGLRQKLILFLGAKGREGTSTVVSSLARVVAECFNRKVAVLDANILRPSQHVHFGVSARVGWDDVLRKTETTEKAFYRTNVDQLWVIPISAAGAETVRVVDPSSIEDFLEVLRERFDLVLIDCAPATTFPGGMAFSRKVDGVVQIIEAECTRWPVAETVNQQIVRAGGRVIGIVLNRQKYYIPELVYNRL